MPASPTFCQNSGQRLGGPAWVEEVDVSASGAAAAVPALRLLCLAGLAVPLAALTLPYLVAVDRLRACDVEEVVVTNTLPLAEDRMFDKLKVLSIAPLVSQAIREVFEDGSVTSMFDGHA